MSHSFHSGHTQTHTHKYLSNHTGLLIVITTVSLEVGERETNAIERMH